MTSILSQISNELAGTVEDVSKGIVRVEARRRLPATGVVWSDDGLIVTTHHVVERDDDIQIGLADGRSLPGVLVGRDPSTDIALIRIEGDNLPSPVGKGEADARVGNLVIAVGRPGNGPRATLGVVSALGDEWRSPAGGIIDQYLQSDVVMYPGFSGGPLVSASGNVIGINTSALVRGVSIAIPVTTVDRVVETLAEHGKIRRGYLGVGGQPVRLPKDIADDLNQETAVMVGSVEADSPAQAAGIFMGDTIVSISGNGITGIDELLAQLNGEQIGKSTEVRILRGGQIQTLSAVVGERE